MRKLIFSLGLLCFTSVLFAQSIREIKTEKGNGWNIMTDNSVYQLRIEDNGSVYPVFWGTKAQAEKLTEQYRTRANGPFRLYETPVRGMHADKMPILEVIYSDKTRDCELELVSVENVNVDGRETLKITQKDKYYPLQVVSYLRVLPEYDIIEKWMEVSNISKKSKDNILIENLLSGSAYLTPDRYFLNHHSGQWVREFQLRKVELTTGIKTLECRDFYAFQNTPWFAVTNKEGDDRNDAEVWFGQVHYSGNWTIDFEVTHSNQLQIVGGINFWDTSLELEPGQTVTSPKFSLGYTGGGTEKAARLVHSYVKKEILPAPHREKTRPVIYNSWYATTFDVNEDHQVELAKKAKEIGVELFVIDDGWFKGRKTDHAGLGDWVVDTDKFPKGLNSMIKRINDMGMDFGIWVEPEMVNPNSDLYREHPDWILNFPNRDRTEWRNQLTLNLAREDVYQYLLKSMSDLLANHNIKFIKWDRNRGLTQPGWPTKDKALNRDVRLKYIANLYRLVDELTKRFPDVMFENCSSGGGRPDLGMLQRMDQTWASDNTDPVDRLFIQYGYLSAYPANTMVCWTNRSDAHKAGLTLDFTFDVAMQGVLGIGQDITKWNKEQLETATRKIAEYKELRNLVQGGTVYRLKSPFEGNKVAIQYVDEKQTETIVFCYNLAEVMEGSTDESRHSNMLRLQNLDEDRMYKINDRPETYSGKYLMDIGFRWPVSGAYKSAIVKINTVNK